MRRYGLKIFLLSVLLLGLVSSGALAGSEPRVAISEVAWSGTQASWADEWVELKNNTDHKIDLSGWSLSWEETKISLGKAENDTISVNNTELKPGGVFLLERTDDETVATVKADLIYKRSLSNSGEKLVLKDGAGKTVDVVDGSKGWMAGTSCDGDPGYGSMELVAGKWETHKQKGDQNDGAGNAIFGSPGSLPEPESE